MRKTVFLKVLLCVSALIMALMTLSACAALAGIIGGDEETDASATNGAQTAQPPDPSDPTASAAMQTPGCAHEYGAWATVRERGCETQGIRQRVCAKCGEKDTVTQPAKGHSPMVDQGEDPTCTTDGLSNGKHCTVCGKVIEAQKRIEAWGHNRVQDPGYPATCEEDGKTDGEHCSNCGLIFTEQTTIPATGHNVIDSPDVPAGCEERGRIGGKHCSNCGKEIEEPEYTPALGHIEVMDDPVPTSCAAPGKTAGSHCSRCEKIIVEPGIIDALPHTPVVDPPSRATCEEEGKGEGSHCAVCGQTIVKQSVAPPLGHDYDESGFCKRCGAEKPKNLPITGITLDQSKIRMEVGESFQLTATLLPEGAIKNRIVWINESKGEYYTVTQDGLITAIKPGKTLVTVYVEDRSTGVKKSFTRTCTIEITQNGGFGDYVPVTGINVPRTEYTLSVGETIKLEFNVIPENATEQRVDIIVEPNGSGERDYISVNKTDRTVTALKPGEGKITLYSVDGGKTRTIHIYIYDE